MENNNEVTVLNSIYRGAKIGAEAICTLLPKTENPSFRSDLATQEQEYQTICQEAASRLLTHGKEPDQLGGMKKAGMKASVEMNTLVNSDTTHLAEMMIQGSTMGITNITKVMNGYANPDPQVIGLAQRLVQVEQQNIERLKSYLQ